MEEFEYKKGLLIVLSKWKYIAISILGTFLISVWVIPNLHEEKYVASVSITLGATNYESLGDNLNQNEQLIFNYNSLIKSDALIDKVIKKNNYDYSVNAVKNMIETEMLEDTTIINIRVENDSEEVAHQILADIIVFLREESINIYTVDNIYVLNDILIESEENFNSFIIIFALTALGGIIAVAVMAVLMYLNKIIAIEENERKILDIEVVSRFFKKQKEINIFEENNNFYLFLKNKKSKIIGFLEDKCCNNKDNLILNFCENIDDKKILVVTYNQQENVVLKGFLEENEYKKQKRRSSKKDTKNNNKQEEKEEEIEIFTSKINKIDFLSFTTIDSITKLIKEPRYMGTLKRRFKNYDYVFIDLNEKDSINAKILSDLCDTILILSKNYVSKEKSIEEMKEICLEKNIANLGIVVN